MERRITHASLFSGIGAPELAAHWMGWQNLFHCEINSFCKTVLSFWFPHSKAYEDIKKTDFTPWRGRIDVLTGGFPCQPFSAAGRRRGTDDDRYLWPEMLRAIREIQPSFVVGENVAGILSMVQPCSETGMEGAAATDGESDEAYEVRQRFVVETVCQDLEREGYSVQPIVVPSCAVGAPHRRDRVWFLAKRNAPDSKSQRWSQNTRADRLDESDKENERPDILGSAVRPCEVGASADTACCGHRASSAHSAAESAGRADDGQSAEWGDATQRTDGLSQVLWPHANPKCRRCSSWRDCRQERQNRNDPDREAGQSHSENIIQSEAACICPAFSDTQRAKEPVHGLPQDFWKDFPTVSPVCCGNDGIPFDLSNLSLPFPKWRSESIKALGNAMVPQVVLELFRAIEQELCCPSPIDG